MTEQYTPNNAIPLVPTDVIDPAAGINLALIVIDRLLQLKVLAVKQNTPPASPASGARYIVGTSPSGAWVGKNLQIAEWMADGYWLFSTANYAAFGSSFYVNTGTDWVAVTGGSGGAAWGAITGTLSSQTDLVAALGLREYKLTAGTNVTIDRTNPAVPVINATGGGSVNWGGIGGTLSNQTDLVSALGMREYALTAGSNITINRTNPLAPVISATGGSSSIAAGAVAVRSTNISIPHNTSTDLVFDQSAYNSGGFINLPTDNVYMTIPVTGVYLLSAAADLAAAASNPGISNVRITTEAGAILMLASAPNVASAANQVSGAALAYITSGTKIKMQIGQTSGDTKEARATSYANRFSVARVI